MQVIQNQENNLIREIQGKKFKNSSVLCNNFNSAQDENESLMRSRYLEQEEHKLNDYDMYENSESQNPSPLPSCRLCSIIVLIHF